MKKIALIFAFLPLVGFADNTTKPKAPSIFSKGCENIADPVERQKDCLLVEKQKEAEEAYRNFQENTHNEKAL
ncbi:hypothetical protein [Legionella maioricensis]|uniref:Uncharacterized protein n=1 Tax=Legionella maioricensis TaxID=2896528 RepID=A0A9X2D3B0_9GAMM|nr:hypothetical protein [Legionella maioricensis]MCL9684867.1 hypothetical protein [Legionella maioricensis]MCL9688943.1 hypothetical protein [Legionella maioricensis]